MTSTFSPRHTSDATQRSADQLTSSKPDFDVVSLLREHPSRTSDASKASGSSTQDSLDFGTVHSLYGSDSTGKAPETQQHQGPDAIKDDPSVPVELIDAASELRRAQDAFKNGDTERANEWMKDAEKNLKSLICDNAKPDGSDSGTHSDNSGSDSGSHSGSDSGSDSGSHSGSDSGSGSGSDGGSDSGSDSYQPSDQQTQIQQMIEILAQALQALANGDMQQFQQLLSGLLAQLEAMTQSNNGPADNAVIPGQGQDSGFGQSDGTNNPTPVFDGNGNPISGPTGLDNPLTGLPQIPGLPGLDGSNPLSGVPQLPGFPGLDGSNPLSGLPQIPGLPGLDGSNPLSGLPQPRLSDLVGTSPLSRLPQIPGLPQLPELPQLPKLPQLPELPSLPGLSGSRGSDNSSSGLPSLPGLPDLGSIFG
ncbi:MAG: hypothetical protein U0103_12875 [Candidatus Obscuribacterales bacterium]